MKTRPSKARPSLLKNRRTRLPAFLATLIAAFLALAFTSLALIFVAPARADHVPGADIIRTIPAGVDPTGFHIQLGYLNATLAPYNADPTGAVDAIVALQNAAIDARDNQLVVFLPSGTYLVSDTIQGKMTAHTGGCETQGSEVNRARPTQILGSRLGAGVTIRLKDNASGFNDASVPKPVFDFFAEGLVNCATVRMKNGSNYNHTLRHVRILIGAGNAGAIGVGMGTAQGGLLEDVKVESVSGAPFFAGALEIPGQGGGAYNFEVNGGQFGAVISNDPPETAGSRFPLMVGCRFTNQTVAGVSYSHSGPLVIAGCYFDEPAGVNGVELLQDPTPSSSTTAKAVGVTIVDSVFALQTNMAAVVNSGLNNVYLNNVYLAAGAVAVRNGSVDWNPGVGKAIINEYAYTNLGTGEQSATNVVDGILTKAEIKTFAAYSPALPLYTDLQARHTWSATELPSFEDTGIVIADASLGGVGAGDVTSALQALIDATSTSTNKKILLPKGIYNISKLTLRQDTKLFGISPYYTVLKSIVNTATSPTPLVETDDSATGTGSLSRMHLITNNASTARNHMLVWQLGKSSRVQNIACDDWGSGGANTTFDDKTYWVKGSGGGRWHSALTRVAPGTNPDFRTYFVEGTTQPLSFYGWSNDNSHAEILGATNVRIFYFKTEPEDDSSDPLKITNSTNVALFGMNGVGSAMTTAAVGAMLTVRDSEQVLASQIRIINKATTTWSYPPGWFTLKEFRGSNPSIDVNPEFAVNAFKRGIFNIGAFDVGATPTPPPAPTGLTATAGNAQVSLSWTASSGATSYNVKRATVSGGPYTTIATGVTATSYTNTGLANGTTYFYVVSAVNASGESANSNQASATPTATSTTVTFTPVAAEDGYVLESTETSNVGNVASATLNSTSSLRAGDDVDNKQYKAVLSFDTSSIPDGATIVSVTLKLRRGTAKGTNPFTTHGVCYVDIKGGTGFGGSTTLAASDFEAAADAVQVATLSNAANNEDLSTGLLNSTGLSFLNKTGKTQFRIYFSLDDNNNGVIDYIGWYSGENATAANRPVLEVVYQ